MNEKNYKKRLDFQQKMISKQSERIKELESELEEKNKIISSISYLLDEMKQNVAKSKEYKEQYEKLIDEVKKMKNILNQEVYKGRWWLIKFLIK